MNDHTPRSRITEATAFRLCGGKRTRELAHFVLTPFERGVVAHLVADWLFQNDWMARNKSNLRHPAAWVHAAIYAVLMGLALGWQAGLVLSALHILVDTRKPLGWWRRVFKQTDEGPAAITTAVWADQVLHIATIAAWVALASQFG